MQLLISEEASRFESKSESNVLIKKALEIILEQEEFSREFIDAAEVSMVFTDDQKMAFLNERYRGVAGTTDVLSFPMLDGEELNGSREQCLLGDIVISVPRALEQAAEAEHTIVEELLFLAVHGMLHLLGYDHQTEDDAERMRYKEKKALEMVSPFYGA